MHKVKVQTLAEQETVPSPILHYPSGVILVEKGEALTDDVKAALLKAGIDEVVELAPGDNADRVRRELTQTSIPVDSLQAGQTLLRSVYDADGRMLLQANTPIPKSFQGSLKRRGIDEIFSMRPEEELNVDLANAARELVKGAIQPKAAPLGNIDAAKVEEFASIELEEADKEDLDAEKLRAKINSLEKIDLPPAGEALLKSLRDRRNEAATVEEKKVFSGIVGESLDVVRAIFGELREGKRSLDVDSLDALTARAMGGMIENRELLMLCGTTNRDSEEYILTHSLAVMVISICVGTSLKYDASQIKSLAYGALFADVGMLNISEEIRNKPDKLSMRERAEVRQHPALGLDMLQRINRIPSCVPYIVYQSHERANGTGYPCGKKDVVIHPFAKIVGAVDVYTSVIAQRPYRDAKMPYEAMEDLLRMCGKKMFNADIMRAFLLCTSLVPVGSFVRLSDERIGRVVAANPQDYTRPMVALLFNESGRLMSEPDRVDLSTQVDISIRQAIDTEELPEPLPDALVGF